ncbi:MAG: hypothetical protein ACLUOI_27125 [Eisenbergiella sp.]
MIVGTGKVGIVTAALLSGGGGACPFDEMSTDKREAEKKLPEGVRAEAIRESFRSAADEAQLRCSALVFRWIRLCGEVQGQGCVWGEAAGPCFFQGKGVLYQTFCKTTTTAL